MKCCVYHTPTVVSADGGLSKQYGMALMMAIMTILTHGHGGFHPGEN